MDIYTIAVWILITTCVFSAIIALAYKIKGKKKDPSLVNVITPFIEGYVLYGLITTASQGAVTNFVYINGFLLLLLFLAGILSLIIND